MANNKGKTEGGSGGKRGHSNMAHWSFTDEIKQDASVQRRIDDKHESEQGIDDYVSHSSPEAESETKRKPESSS